jgi:uncharacterized protein YjiS (DUF1127 family)
MSHTLQNTKTFFDISFVFNAFSRFARNCQRRKHANKTIRELSALSNRELSDMGISRGDIYSIAYDTFHGEYPDTKANRNLKGWV